MKLSNTEIITGIVNKNRQVLNEVYLNYLPVITRLVKSNSGSESEALDIFQDGLVVLYEKLKTTEDPDKIQCAAYLTKVCKNLWLNQIRSKKMGKEKRNNIVTEQPDLSKEIWNDMLQSQRYELYRKHFRLLGEDCQKVLRLFHNKVSLRNIAQKMGFTEQYAKKKKFKCQKSLIASIENDHMYLELINN